MNTPNAPKRIQRQRTRGWKKPKGSICVTRGTPWGNPFVVRPDLEPGAQINRLYTAVPTLEDAIECFRIRVVEMPDQFPPLTNLRGKDLACWCGLCDLHKLTGKPLGDQCAECEPCHVDVLLPLANPKETSHVG